jgi:hypothetical protein
LTRSRYGSRLDARRIERRGCGSKQRLRDADRRISNGESRRYADQFTGLMREYWKIDQEKQWEVDSLRAQSEHFRLMLKPDPAE